MKILIVDDEKDLAQFIKKILENNGHEVVCYETGEPLLEEVFEWSYDLLILDLMLPGTSGMSLLKEIRDKGIKIPILIMSGLIDPEVKNRVLKGGANDYLSKPFDIQELLSRIHRIHSKVT